MKKFLEYLGVVKPDKQRQLPPPKQNYKQEIRNNTHKQNMVYNDISYGQYSEKKKQCIEALAVAYKIVSVDLNPDLLSDRDFKHVDESQYDLALTHLKNAIKALKRLT